MVLELSVAGRYITRTSLYLGLADAEMEGMQGQHTQQGDVKERPRGGKEVASDGAGPGFPRSAVTQADRPH